MIIITIMVMVMVMAMKNTVGVGVGVRERELETAGVVDDDVVVHTVVALVELGSYRRINGVSGVQSSFPETQTHNLLFLLSRGGGGVTSGGCCCCSSPPRCGFCVWRTDLERQIRLSWE